MAIRPESYGTVADVEALTKRYTSSGSYGTGTNPTKTQVEEFVNRMSGVVNVLLAEQGFTIPVTQADAKLALADFVVGQVALLCHAANGHGIYAPGSQSIRNTTPMRLILAEAEAFIGKHASGIEALGAARTKGLAWAVECRTEDDAGNVIEPVFERKMMGNVVVDWDSA